MRKVALALVAHALDLTFATGPHTFDLLHGVTHNVVHITRSF